jgi:hypothetical protein
MTQYDTMYYDILLKRLRMESNEYSQKTSCHFLTSLTSGQIYIYIYRYITIVSFLTSRAHFGSSTKPPDRGMEACKDLHGCRVPHCSGHSTRQYTTTSGLAIFINLQLNFQRNSGLDWESLQTTQVAQRMGIGTCKHA